MAIGSGLTSAALAGEGFDLGPIAYRGVGLDGAGVFKAAGPFYELNHKRGGGVMRALRPLYAYESSPWFERWRREFVWPLADAKGFKDELSWRFLIWYGTDFDVNDPASRYRVWLLPIYFQGRDKGGDGYWAVFPLGGSVHEFLTRDEIDFALFPLWVRHTINDIVTNTWLFPIISKTTGPGVERFRVFPLYGRAWKEGVHFKRFILWPIWTEAYWLREGAEGYGYILFPLWGHAQTKLEETWYVLPPFFRFTRGEERDLTYAPWPFYQRIKGANLDRLYIWPLWGRTYRENFADYFFLWPLGWHERVEGKKTVDTRSMLLPFYYNYAEKWNTPGKEDDDALSRYFKIWPIFSYDREGKQSEFRTLALWPGRNPGPVERGWAPLWNIYQRESDGERFRSEFLWGMYRHTRDGEKQKSFTLFPLFSWGKDGREKEWTLLNGLAGFRKNGTNRSWRFLYLFEFGDEGEKQ